MLLFFIILVVVIILQFAGGFPGTSTLFDNEWHGERIVLTL